MEHCALDWEDTVLTLSYEADLSLPSPCHLIRCHHPDDSSLGGVVLSSVFSKKCFSTVSIRAAAGRWFLGVVCWRDTCVRDGIQIRARIDVGITARTILFCARWCCLIIG